MAARILIASAEHLSDLQRRDDLREAIAFAGTDALQALDAITRWRPDVVAIERNFATTSRGAALIERIAGDPALAACEIRVVALDDGRQVRTWADLERRTNALAAPFSQMTMPLTITRSMPAAGWMGSA